MPGEVCYKNLSCTNRLGLFIRNEPSAMVSEKDPCLCCMRPFTEWEGKSYGSREIFVFMKASRPVAERLHLKSKTGIPLSLLNYLIRKSLIIIFLVLWEWHSKQTMLLSLCLEMYDFFKKNSDVKDKILPPHYLHFPQNLKVHHLPLIGHLNLL